MPLRSQEDLANFVRVYPTTRKDAGRVADQYAEHQAHTYPTTQLMETLTVRPFFVRRGPRLLARPGQHPAGRVRQLVGGPQR